MEKYNKDYDHVSAAHPLEIVFRKVVDQVKNGKGKRHGGTTIPFMDQKWNRISKGSSGVGGLAYQVIKKTEESLDKPSFEEFEREILGAIAYAGMLYLSKKESMTGKTDV